MNNSEIITEHYKKIGSKGGKSWWYGLSDQERAERIKKLVSGQRKKSKDTSKSQEITP